MTPIPLKKLYSGKVRDLYEIDEQTMLIIASDRLSAFDVILNEPIPQKGEILTQISNFWFNKLAHIMPNHFTGQTVYDILPEATARAIAQRTVVAKRLTPDSSRFWAAQSYQVGSNPPSFDKQFIRDWLERSGWNKQPPAPAIPEDVLAKTVAKYQEALRLLTA